MLRTYILSAVALAGFSFAVFMSQQTNATTPVAQPAGTPASSPFDNTIAGAGIVESRNENISIGTPVAGIVTDVFVKVGQTVESGAPLFVIDNRTQTALLGVKRAALESARQKLQRLQNWPRKEDIESARARASEMESSLSEVKNYLQTAEAVHTKLPGSIGAEEIIKRRSAVEVAAARVDESRAQLSLLTAGAWSHDIEVIKSEIALAEAETRAVEAEIDKSIVRAPIAGEILKVNIRKGEYAQTGGGAESLMMIGDVSKLHVRVDIDESDIWRFRGDCPATALVRGNAKINTPLTYVRAESYVIPKISLTGESSERVDTRVLQVIYQFDRGTLPIFVGVQVDVFINIGAQK
ncbi:MAG: HlyD family secretion protein [Planctomycetota bacterium]